MIQRLFKVLLKQANASHRHFIEMATVEYSKRNERK